MNADKNLSHKQHEIVVPLKYRAEFARAADTRVSKLELASRSIEAALAPYLVDNIIPVDFSPQYPESAVAIAEPLKVELAEDSRENIVKLNPAALATKQQVEIVNDVNAVTQDAQAA